MAIGIFEFVGKLIEPIRDVIDDLHYSREEKAELDLKVQEMQTRVAERIMEYEHQLLELRSDAIKAEAIGKSWLQRNWRPITMLTFLVLMVCDSFGMLAFRLSGDAWTLLQIGIGGYVAGRSLEKMTPKVTDIFKKTL